MITIDCPLCAGEATTDESLAAVTCDGCGITVDIAPGPGRRAGRRRLTATATSRAASSRDAAGRPA